MAPSLFSIRPLADDLRHSPPKSRLKSFSALLTNPFSSSPSSSQGPSARTHLIPSAPIPYYPPKTEIPLSNLSSKSPFRVYIKDAGLPPSSLSLGHGPSSRDEGVVTGLPVSHYALAALSGGGGLESAKPIWREMPTLASAINISDSAPPTSTTFGPTKPLISHPLSVYPDKDQIDTEIQSHNMPRSTSSNSSIFGSYRNRRNQQPSTRPSAKQLPNNTDAPRRMSRRLSFDNVLRPLGSRASFRRKNKERESQENKGDTLTNEVYRGPVMEARKIAYGNYTTEHQASVNPAGKLNRLTLPPMRSLRSKFIVGGKTRGSLSSVAKVDLAAMRRIHNYDNTGNERRPAAGVASTNNTNPSTVGSLSGRGVLETLGIVTRPTYVGHPLDYEYVLVPEEISSPSSGRLEHPTSQTVLQLEAAVKPETPAASIPTPASISVTHTESSPQAQCKPKEPSAAPLTSRSDRITSPLSPAQNEESTIDPSHSPLPLATSIENLGSPFPPFPDPPHRVPDLASSSSLSAEQEFDDVNGIARRQQSLSEIRNAFGRMRNISGLDVSSQLSSAPPSRQVSDGQAPHNTATGHGFLVNAVTSDIKSTNKGDTDSEGPLSRAHGGRSWHTAQEDAIPLSPPRGLRSSRSKSTHDLSTLASDRDLVEEMEIRHGEGWWSASRVRTMGRRASNYDFRSDRMKMEDDERIEVLEKIAKNTTVSYRSRFTNPAAEPMEFTPVRDRPHSALNVRSDILSATATDRTRRSIDIPAWRPSSVQDKPHSHLLGSRHSVKTASPWSRGQREALLAEDTPTRPSARRGPSLTSKISPVIARRASYLTDRIEGGRSPSRLLGTAKSTLQEIEGLKERHAVEHDALVGALSQSKTEVKGLKDEIEELRRALNERTVEKEGLRKMVDVLETKLEDMSGSQHSTTTSSRGRSASMISTLLPDLTVPNETLVMDVSPLGGPFPFSPDGPDDGDIDEFGRSHLDKRRNIHGARAMRRRDNRDSTIYDTSAGSDYNDGTDDHFEMGSEWTLKLKKADEAHLNDLRELV